ncbi:hypothetical protein HZD82_26390, partial [Pantoea agglomerans]|nr:hypothetical protein [Pantoea agglomerans]
MTHLCLSADSALNFNSNPLRPEDVIFSLGRVVKLNLDPSFILTQLGWNKDNVDGFL